jgi:hypothetical protein
MSLRPVPFKDYIPRIYWDDPQTDALAAEIDADLTEWFDDIRDLERLRDPARIPASLIEELGDLLNAGLQSFNSDRIRREKVYTAIQGHKRRGSWELDAKTKVDAIAGGDSSLFSGIADGWWVLADGTEPSSYYWSAFGVESEEGFDGIILTGVGDEAIFPGNIRIDTDNSGLTASEIAQLKIELADVVPSYFRVILGYVSGGFIEYANGRIE